VASRIPFQTVEFSQKLKNQGEKFNLLRLSAANTFISSKITAEKTIICGQNIN
jgi:hypothetical protein